MTPESVLEVGSLRLPHASPRDFRSLFPESRFVGLDIMSGPGVDLVYDGRRLPFDDESFDFVIVSETLEHCASPSLVVGECFRILKRGGLLVATVPFDFPIHNEPDYWRFTEDGVYALFSWLGRMKVYRLGWKDQPVSFGVTVRKQGAAPELKFKTAPKPLVRRWVDSFIHSQKVAGFAMKRNYEWREV